MSKVKFELNQKGVAELMKSAAMQDVLKGHASQIKNRVGEGYEQDIYVGKNRANAQVWAATNEARKENSKNNTLLKAMR